ncbi:hypothetical protein [Sphingomonas sp. 8AM]|uniref:hypothetical protein n=1 Tax=Sphingomonas sp. 8AM TaxID=2653170 RepID=UPI00135C4AD0|nr:hypothetical protein [Sphingomonas sp. 8AM]
MPRDHVRSMYETAMFVEVMIISAAHALQITVSLMKKKKNGGALDDMDAGEALRVGFECVAGDVKGRGAHYLLLVQVYRREQSGVAIKRGRTTPR